MSVRYLFADGNFVSIPAVGSAENGQALTVVDGAFQWVTPGAGPAGPIQDVVSGNIQQITAVKNDITGVVTVDMPDNVYINTLYIGNDSTVATSGYALPLGNLDVDNNPLVADSNYSLKYTTNAGAPAQMKWTASTSNGITSIDGTQGVTASPPTSGSVTIGLGNITPNKVTSTGSISGTVLNAATSVVIGSGADQYTLPLSVDTLATGNYVMALTAGAPGVFTFTPQTASGGGTMTGVTQGANISITGNANVDPTISLDSTLTSLTSVSTATLIASSELEIGSGANAYKMPVLGSPLTDGDKYVLQYTAATSQMEFTQETAGGAGVQSVTSKNDGTVGSGIIVDNSDDANPILELGNIVPLSISVKGEYTLPETTGAANYAMVMPASGTQLTWAPISGTSGGTMTGVTQGANISITGNANVDPTISLDSTLTSLTSVSTATLIASSELEIGSGANAYKMPILGAPLTDGDKYVLQYSAATSQMEFTQETAGGAGVQTVEQTHTIAGTTGYGIIVDNTDTANPKLSLANIQPNAINVNGAYSLPTAKGTAGQCIGLDPSADAQLTWVTPSSGSGTVTSLVAGSNIEITGATPTIDPTVSLNPVITGITSIAASGNITTTTGTVQASALDVTPSATTNKTLLNINNNAFTIKSGAADANGSDLSFIDRDSAAGFKCVNNVKGFQIITNDAGTIPPSPTVLPIGYILPTVQPTATDQVLAVDVLQTAAGFTTTKWIAQSGGGEQIEGTINQIVADTVTTPNTAKLSLAPQVIITDESTFRPSLTVGSCVIGAETSGSPAVTLSTLTLTNPDLGNGIIVDHLGTHIQVGDGQSPPVLTQQYTLPITTPNLGDFMVCTTAADGPTPAVCAWAPAAPGSSANATVVLQGIVIRPNTIDVVQFPSSSARTYEIDLYQVGLAKYIFMDFDTIYSAGGCLYTNADSGAIIGELDCGTIDITDAQGLVPILITNGQDVNIGTIYYSTTTLNAEHQIPTTAYGYASVILKLIDVNTLTIRIVLPPKGSATNAITDNTYGIAPNTYLTLAAVQPLYTTPATALGNQTPSAKCVFTYY